jgi:hypothetical protein
VSTFQAKPGYKQWVAQAGTLVADLLTCAGADHIITLDLHDSQYQGFFDVPVDNLYAKGLLQRYIMLNIPNYKEAIIVSPDAGGAKRASAIADALGLGFSLIHKERRPTKITDRQSSSMILVGDVTDRVCIIIDDLIDTGNTVRMPATPWSILPLTNHTRLSVLPSSSRRRVPPPYLPWSLTAFSAVMLSPASRTAASTSWLPPTVYLKMRTRLAWATSLTSLTSPRSWPRLSAARTMANRLVLCSPTTERTLHLYQQRCGVKVVFHTYNGIKTHRFGIAFGGSNGLSCPPRHYHTKTETARG